MNKKISVKRLLLLAFFAIYLFIILDFTLFGFLYGHRFTVWGFWNINDLREYAKFNVNLIPFATLKLMLNGVWQNKLTVDYFYKNFFGNILLFMPMAFFLPRIFKKVSRFGIYLIIVALIIALIEILQFFNMAGALDIDDWILNFSGAAIAYPLFKLRENNNGK